MSSRSLLLLAATIGALLASSASAESSDTNVAAGPAWPAGAAAAASQSDNPELANPAPPPAQPSGWEFSAGPYLWMSGLKGDLGVVEQVEPVAVDLSFFDIMRNLKFALMGTFDARKGRFVASSDLLFLKLRASEDIKIREIDFLEVDLTSTTFITTLTAGYRAIDKEPTSLDLLAGARINSMKTSLDLEGPRRSFSGSKRKTWVDPIIGLRIRTPLGEKWSLEAYGDVGGFGIASDLTWQLAGLVKYDLNDRWSLSGGWRHLDTDFEDNGFVFDAAMDGPILGAVYRF